MYNERVPNLYTTQKDLSDRLHDTVCRYDGKPVYVLYETTSCLSLYDLGLKNLVKKISPDDPFFDISSIELGYGNYVTDKGAKVFQCLRSPSRQYKQGLKPNELGWKTIDGKEANAGATVNGLTAYLWKLQGFEDLLTNTFPSFSQGLQEGRQEFAISKQVAVRKDEELGIYIIYVLGTKVAYIDPSEHLLKVSERTGLEWVVHRLLKNYEIQYQEK